jgi:hypothetical protein
VGRNPAGSRARPNSHPFPPTPAQPNAIQSKLARRSRAKQRSPANSRARANGPACPCRRPPRSRPEMNRSEAATLCSLRILTKSEPNWNKVGLEIEFNLPARSPTEKPYKKVPRWPSIPSNSVATLTSLPAVVMPLHRIFRPTEALSSTAGTQRCRWSAPHREPVTREAPRRQRTGREKPRRHQPSTSPTASS